MAELRIQNLAKQFPGVKALDGVTLTVANGECLAVLGASGCGKTTLLRIIAGLEEQTSGTVLVDGQPIDDLPPHRRGVAMIFQDFPLYPHMTVRKNLAFPLRMRRASRDEIETAVSDAAAMLGLSAMLNRKPGALSGGEQQRVALGRVVVSGAKIALLDEPLSNLDARLRKELRRELKSLQSRLGLTMLFVTHDQQEAAAVGGRIAVMMSGRIVQAGSPKDVYRNPANDAVADFLGVTTEQMHDAR